MTLRDETEPGFKSDSKIYREIAMGKRNRLDSQISHL
jgi:hypothetical protein